MEEWSNNSFENEEDFETYDEYYKEVKEVKVAKIKKPYVKCDDSKKNRTNSRNSERKAKFIRQGR